MRNSFLDIAPIFSHIVYEPVTYSKVEQTTKELSDRMESSSLTQTEQFNLTALVVEDNLVNQKVIVHTLKSLGIISDVANEGQSAVAMFKEKKYDIIFMDIQMPVMNGVTATKHILAYETQKQLEHTPIVAVTTNTLEGDRERYLDVGMDDYIPKPISASKFVNVLKQFYATTEKGDVESHKKDILLYKKSPTEAKIIAAIFLKSGYSVEVANSVPEFKNLMSQKVYKTFLLDKTLDSKIHDEVLSNIKKSEPPSILFSEDPKSCPSKNDEKYIVTMPMNAGFVDIKAKVDELMEL